MESRLKSQFAVLEKQKAAILTEVAPWGDPARRFRSNPAEWCALDVIDHLQRTEAAILSFMQACLQHPAKAVTAADNLRGLLLVLLFRTPARVQAPGSVSAIVPNNPSDLSELAGEWDRGREGLAKFLECVTPGQLRIAAFQHPVAGWMTLPRTLDFLSAHIQHHRFQLRRLKKARAAT